MYQTNSHRGFSLLEALIVVGLIAVVAAATLPRLTRSLFEYRLQVGAQQLGANLRFARMAAVKERQEFKVKIKDETDSDDPNTYLVERNSGGSWETYARADTTIPPGLKILTGGLTEVRFNARGGANTSGSISLRGANNSNYRIDVFTTGAVNVVLLNTGG